MTLSFSGRELVGTQMKARVIAQNSNDVVQIVQTMCDANPSDWCQELGLTIRLEKGALGVVTYPDDRTVIVDGGRIANGRRSV